MTTLLIAVGAFVGYIVAYHTYGRWLARRVFGLDPSAPVPSQQLRDDVDFIPTKKSVIFGHHFTSIAGTGPIVGPAIAVFWGWLPALLWVVFGSIFIGAVHDFGALVVSIRNRGQTIGEVAGRLITPRAKVLMLSILFMALTIVLAIFGLVIASVFKLYPESVLSVWIEIPIAIAIGFWVYRRQGQLLIPSLAALALMYGAIYIGAYHFPIVLPAELGEGIANAIGIDPSWTNPVVIWTMILMLYCFVASVLPVWTLLQPRDYINSHQLVLALTLLLLGLVVAGVTGKAQLMESAPAVADLDAVRLGGAPPIWPFLFITIACGAISGFHGLVASGTTSKQVSCMTDARPIGYGGMLGEGALGMLAVLAATAGFSSAAEWHGHYASWGAANGLSAKLDAFVSGGATFVAALGIPIATAKTFIAVMVIAFAATSLDTGARIQRLIIAELAEGYGVKALTNRYAAGALGIAAALLLAVTQAGGKGGLILWPLFGTTNQLVAGVTLLMVSVWLRQQGRAYVYTLVPMVFVGIATVFSMLSEVCGYFGSFSEQWLLAIAGSIILILDVWVIGESVRVLLKDAPERRAAEA